MNTTEATTLVRRYNAWRRGDDDSEMPQPEDIGQALNALCDHAERMERDLEQERQDRTQADLDTIRALGERNSAREEVRLLGEQLKAFDETAIEWWCEYQDLKAKARQQ